MKKLKKPKTIKQEWIYKLIKQSFEKVEQESNETSAYSLSKYLSEKIEKDIDKGGIDERTLNRYYTNILEKENKNFTPNKVSLDLLARYIDFDDFNDFIFKTETEIEKIKRELEEKNEKLQKKLIISLFGVFILLGALVFFISKYYKKNCMIWVEDHFEKIRCSSVVRLDLVKLEKFKKIEVCDTTTFIKNGKAFIWYDKSNNKLDYFTYPGIHPDNGKTLKQITNTIINSHVKPCKPIIIQSVSQ